MVPAATPKAGFSMSQLPACALWPLASNNSLSSYFPRTSAVPDLRVTGLNGCPASFPRNATWRPFYTTSQTRHVGGTHGEHQTRKY